MQQGPFFADMHHFRGNRPYTVLPVVFLNLRGYSLLYMDRLYLFKVWVALFQTQTWKSLDLLK